MGEELGKSLDPVGASCWRGLDTLESACTSQVLQRYADERYTGQLERHTVGKQGWAQMAAQGGIRLGM